MTIRKLSEDDNQRKAMNRHLLYLFGIISSIAGSPAHVISAARTNRPNVIFIYADDLGKGLLSYEGQKIIKTPNIDKLAKNGVTFSKAYGCMLCAPARASLLTGYHDCHQDKWQITQGGIYKKISSGELSTEQVESKINSTLKAKSDSEVFLPHVFKIAGYITAEIGKLEWGFSSSHEQMEHHGWDYYYGYLDHVQCHGYYPPFLFENRKLMPIEGNTRIDCGKSLEPETEKAYNDRWNMTGKKTYSQDLFLEKILSFIRIHKDQPFFLYHPTQLPHGPVSVPRIHPDFINDNRLTPIEKEYASMVKMLDDNVGIIMEELKKQKLQEKTIVIFSSDNGHEIYYAQKGRCEKPYMNMQTGLPFNNITDKFYSEFGGDVFNGNDGMAGLKRSNWEGGVRIPLIVSWPGTINPHESSALVANYDFINTFSDLLKIRIGQAKDGQSFLPVLLNQGNGTVHKYVVFASYMGPALVTDDGWKLRYYIQKDIFQLYYLPDDYREERDRISENPEKFQELKSKLLSECNGNFQNGLFLDKNILPI